MGCIQVGRYSLNDELLIGFKLEEAYKNFSTIEKRIVKQAWERANPKKVRK